MHNRLFLFIFIKKINILIMVFAIDLSFLTSIPRIASGYYEKSCPKSNNIKPPRGLLYLLGAFSFNSNKKQKIFGIRRC